MRRFNIVIILMRLDHVEIKVQLSRPTRRATVIILVCLWIVISSLFVVAWDIMKTR